MSNDILVFVEQREGTVKKASFEALTLGRSLAEARGSALHAVLIGNSVESLASAVAAFGAAKVHVLESADLALYSGDGYAKALQNAVQASDASLVLASHTAMGKDLMPRAAMLCDAGLVSDATSVSADGDALVVTKPVFAGKAFKTYKAASTPFFVSLRPNAVQASEASGAGEVVKGEAPAAPFLAIVKEILAASGTSVPLQEAGVIVSGGRGLKDASNWHLVEELAAAFGPGVAAVGASRAVTDGGWVPHSIQVGQTGKVVAPNLYIAVGISGAIQHMAGMSTSKFIVAINKDPEAPIFKVANYGIVGDALEVVPALTAAIQAATAG